MKGPSPRTPSAPTGTPRIARTSIGQASRPVRQLAGTGAATTRETTSLLSGHRPRSLAAAILALVGYAAALNALHGGPAQLKGWLGAKFLNRPWTPSAAAPSGTGPVPAPRGVPAPVAAGAPSTGVLAPATLGAA